MKLGRERALADARRVRLGDADDAIDLGRADAGALTRARGDRRAAGHVRIRAVIEIEQAALRTFEQDMAAFRDRARDVTTCIAGVLAQLLARGECVIDPLVDLELARNRAAEMLDLWREIVEVRADERTQPL